MDVLVAWIQDFLTREWAVTLRAWKPLLLITALVGVGVWWTTSTFYATLYQGTIAQLEAASKVDDKRIAQEQAGRIQVEDALKKLQEENERLRVQSALPRLDGQPYIIKKEERERFIQVLSSSGKYTVTIAFTFGDYRAEDFATVLRGVVEKSGWVIDEFNGMMGGGEKPGVTIWVKEGQEIPTGASMLLGLLVGQNIEARINQRVPQKNKYTTDFFVVVGRGPQDSPDG